MAFYLPDLHHKLTAGIDLTTREQAYVETQAQSSIPIEAIRANAILAISGATDRRKAALDRLELLCNDQLDSDAKASFAMMAGLLFLVDPLPFTGSLRAFVFRMAKGGTTGCRVNAIVVLERLAFAGDAAAKSLIQECTTDPDERVKQNATSALNHLRM